jgi:hypothetical protein
MKIKIILGILVALVVLLVIAAVVVGTHLDAIVKAGIEVGGPRVTQTTLTVDAVTISLLSGSAEVKGLVLGNPAGYSAPQSIRIGNAAVSLAPGSVLSDKIVIHSITVNAADITFEGNPLGANNLTKIMDNVDALTGPADQADANAPAATPGGPKKAGKKLEVDYFLLTGATVHANLTGWVNRELTLPLPDIHFTGLGQGADGVTDADLTRKILSAITAGTLKALVNSVDGLGKHAAGAAKGAVRDAANGAGAGVNKLKQGLGGLFGK